MMNAFTPAADLDVSVRARRLACVLDPALLLAAPHALLLAQQLARGVDQWVCPGFWRLLDASEFFARRPARLRAWLALPGEHPAESVGAAIAAWSRWRVSRDLASVGLYWVGGHQTESFLPEHAARDLPARFEALMESWARAPEVEEGGEPAAVQPREAAVHGLRSLAAARVGAGAGDDDEDAAAQDDPRAAPAQRHEGAQEAAALAVALQAPVLTLAGAANDVPAVLQQWNAAGLAGLPWQRVHAASAAAERERWWNAVVAAGAAATLAAASTAGLRLALVHVIAPSGQLLAQETHDAAWIDAFGGAEAWGNDPLAAPGAGTVPAGWWQDAQALWIEL